MEPSCFKSKTVDDLIKPVSLRLQPPYPRDCESDSFPFGPHTEVQMGAGDNCKQLSKSSFKDFKDCGVTEEESLGLEVWAAFEHEQKVETVSFHQSPPSVLIKPVPVCPVHLTEGESEHDETKLEACQQKSVKKKPLRYLLRGLRKLFRRRKL